MTIRYDADDARLECSVHDLIPVVPERFGGGVLNVFRSLARMQQGTQVHLAHQKKQADALAGYRREVAVELAVEVDAPRLDGSARTVKAKVQGRIDGAWQEGNRLQIEEVKSVQLAGSALPRGVTPAQMRRFSEQVAIYALMLEQSGMAFQAMPPPTPTDRSLWAATGERSDGDDESTSDAGSDDGGHGLEGHATSIEIVTSLVLVSAFDGGRATVSVDWQQYSIETLIVPRLRAIIANLDALAHRQAERQELGARITLPFVVDGVEQYRPFQREMIDAIEDADANKDDVLICAPTGIGKTAAALTASARNALSNGGVVFYVTAKTTQQELVIETARRWHDNGLKVRTIALAAKAKLCANDVIACHPDACPFARDYTDKLERANLPDAMWRDDTVLTPDAIFEIGSKHEVCPFELALDALLSADVIVADYNYVFDPQVALARFFDEPDPIYGGRYRLVIDEAHNLVARGRDAYSPALPRSTIERALNAAHALPDSRAHRLLAGLFAEWRTDLAALAAEMQDVMWERARDRDDKAPTFLPLSADAVDEWRARLKTWSDRLDELLPLYADFKRREGFDPRKTDDPILDAVFDFRRFVNVVALDGDEFVLGYVPSGLNERDRPPRTPARSNPSQAAWRSEPPPPKGNLFGETEPRSKRSKARGSGPGGAGVSPARSGGLPRSQRAGETPTSPGLGTGDGLKVMCRNPGPQLGRRLRDFHSTAAMSATLTPFVYFRRLLGFREKRTRALALPTPFPRENLAVFIDRSVATTYRQRERNYARIACQIARTASLRAGNYLVAFPSYDFLERVVAELRRAGVPDEALLIQNRGMSDSARQSFMARVREASGMAFQAMPPDRSTAEPSGVGERERADSELRVVRDVHSPDGGHGLEGHATLPLLICTVQGGIFTEGVDYAGDACIGVFVVGPALPRFDDETELIRAYVNEHAAMFDEYSGEDGIAHDLLKPSGVDGEGDGVRDDAGFDYAYRFPGMHRVIQSAGRLIRTPTDRGFIALMDFRFALPAYRACFPPHWTGEAAPVDDETAGSRNFARAHVVNDLASAVAQFWRHHNLVAE